MASKKMQDRLTQKIALFQMVNRVPNQPLRWHRELIQQEASRGKSGQRILSLEHEIRLVEAFAFIAHHTEDPSKVSAVAVQVEDQGRRLCVFVSVNRGSAGNIVKCFHDIFAQLPNWSDSRTILPIMLRLHCNKCLCMLQSLHAHHKGNFGKRKASRPCPLELFATACQSSNVAQGSELQVRAEEMLVLFCDLEAVTETDPARDVQIVRILLQIVDVCHQVCKMDELLTRVLSTIAGPIERDALRRKLSYFSSFHTTCRELKKTRQRLPLLERAISRAIQLEPAPLPANQLHLEVCSMLPAASRKLERSCDEVRDALLKECQMRHPVHAEIQLLVYLDMIAAPSPTKPRVIRSGKEACYLCHAFFAAHGKFLSLGTHGRLYEKWALPRILQTSGKGSTDAMERTLQRFQSNLTSSLSAVLLEGHRRPYPDPLEEAHFLTPDASTVVLNNSSATINSRLNVELPAQASTALQEDRSGIENSPLATKLPVQASPTVVSNLRSLASHAASSLSGSSTASLGQSRMERVSPASAGSTVPSLTSHKTSSLSDSSTASLGQLNVGNASIASAGSAVSSLTTHKMSSLSGPSTASLGQSHMEHIPPTPASPAALQSISSQTTSPRSTVDSPGPASPTIVPNVPSLTSRATRSSSDPSTASLDQAHLSTRSALTTPDTLSLKIADRTLHLYFDYAAVQASPGASTLRQATACVLEKGDFPPAAEKPVDVETLKTGHDINVPTHDGLFVLKMGKRQAVIRLPSQVVTRK